MAGVAAGDRVIIQATTQASGIERFVPVGIATKLLVSLGIGLLVGFEREWSHKDLGVRTFALVSLLGMLTTLASPPFAWIGMAAVVLLVTGLNVGHVLLRREVEATTAVALVVTFVLGVLVGDGHVFTPTASAILMTLLLAVKPQLTRFAGGITAEEIRGAVLLGLIGFVIYPVLPNRPVDPWNLVNPREVWLTVILIAGIGFVNYVLLRVYSTRGLYYTALFGGLVNSTATIAELGEATRDTGEKQRVIITLTLITVIAMYVRNLAILAAFSPSSGLIALAPIAAMCVFTSAVVFRMRQTADEGAASRLSSPISFRKIGSFGLFFLGVQALATLAQRFLGTAGSVAVSFLGGFISSASATAAAGTLTVHHEMTPRIAAICTVMASIASALVNLPLIYRTSRGAGVFRRLILLSALTTMIGVAVLVTVLLSLK